MRGEWGGEGGRMRGSLEGGENEGRLFEIFLTLYQIVLSSYL